MSVVINGNSNNREVDLQVQNKSPAVKHPLMSVNYMYLNNLRLYNKVE